MDAEGARRAFEPYFSTKTGGSGLGLANAQRSVEALALVSLATGWGRDGRYSDAPADRPAAHVQ
jgi:hypothetical protein